MTAVAVGLGCSAAGGATLGPESWYDAEHGWRARRSNVEETNDGGATWRKIFPRPLENLNGVLRTGLKAGLWYEAGCCGSSTFWTNHGRRFFESPAIRIPATGQGRFFFRWSARRVFRVTPWPFPTACVAESRTGNCVYVDKRGRRRSAAFATQLVATVPAGTVANVVTVPGGFVAVNYADTPSDPPFAVVARWTRSGGSSAAVNGQSLTTDGVTNLSSCGAVYVDWPTILIPACTVVENSRARAGYWQSLDGGGSWDYRPPTAR